MCGQCNSTDKDNFHNSENKESETEELSLSGSFRLNTVLLTLELQAFTLSNKAGDYYSLKKKKKKWAQQPSAFSLKGARG